MKRIHATTKRQIQHAFDEWVNANVTEWSSLATFSNESDAHDVAHAFSESIDSGCLISPVRFGNGYAVCLGTPSRAGIDNARPLLSETVQRVWECCAKGETMHGEPIKSKRLLSLRVIDRGIVFNKS